MDVFSSQLRMIKCSEVRHFSMKFPSEGESCHCHFAGKKLGASNQMFQPKYGSENNKMWKVRYSIPPTVGILNNHCTQIELLLNRVQYIFIATCWIPTLNQSIKTLHFGTHWTHWTDLKWVLVIRFSKILQKNFIIASSRLLDLFLMFLMEDLPDKYQTTIENQYRS